MALPGLKPIRTGAVLVPKPLPLFRLAPWAAAAIAVPTLALASPASAAPAPGSSCKHPLVFTKDKARGHQTGNPKLVKLAVKETKGALGSGVGVFKLTWKVLSPNLEVCPLGILVEVKHSGEKQPKRITGASGRSGRQGGILPPNIEWVGITVKARFIHAPKGKAAANSQPPPVYVPETIHECYLDYLSHTKGLEHCVRMIEHKAAKAPGTSCKHPLEVNRSVEFSKGGSRNVKITLSGVQDANHRGSTETWHWKVMNHNVEICRPNGITFYVDAILPDGSQEFEHPSVVKHLTVTNQGSFSYHALDTSHTIEGLNIKYRLIRSPKH
jgi:hypothetical protein